MILSKKRITKALISLRGCAGWSALVLFVNPRRQVFSLSRPKVGLIFKRDDFNFEIVNFPFLDGDVPRSTSYGVYISQLIRFARVCSNVDDFNNRNLFLTAKLLKQGYRYHKIRKAFSKFYHRHSELIVKYNIGLKTLLQQGISEPIFYGDLVYKFKRIVGKPNISDQFKKIVKRYIRVGYNLDIMRQSACLVVNPITVYSYGFLFNCTTVGWASDSMTALT